MLFGHVHLSIKKILSLLLSALSIPFISCTQNKRTHEGMLADGKEYKQGRFSIRQPQTLKYHYSEYAIHGVVVNVIKKQYPAQFDSVYNQLLKEVNDLKEKRELKTDKIGEIVSIKQTSPGNTSIIYHKYDNSRIFTYCSIIEKDSVIIKFSIDGSEEYYQECLNRINSVAGQYAPIQSDEVSNPFYISNTLFERGNSYEKETSVATYKDTVNDINLTWEMESLNKSEWKALNKSAIPGWLLSLSGVKIHTIRKGNRTVAGLKGRETVMTGKAKNNDVFFYFEFNGVADDVRKPKMKITMQCDKNNIDSTIAIWDAMLDSIQLIL